MTPENSQTCLKALPVHKCWSVNLS